jgi:hypothetical protein
VVIVPTAELTALDTAEVAGVVTTGPDPATATDASTANSPTTIARAAIQLRRFQKRQDI